MSKVLLLISILFFSLNSFSQEEVINVIEQPAEYPGGRTAMNQFIGNNIKYPESALNNGISGKVYARFVISKKGKVSDVTIIAGLTPECDAEVIRVLKKMPKWKPARSNGKKVYCYFTLPVTFNVE